MTREECIERFGDELGSEVWAMAEQAQHRETGLTVGAVAALADGLGVKTSDLVAYLYGEVDQQ